MGKQNKYFWLERLPIARGDKLATRLLNGARKQTVTHLFSEDGDKFFSGFLTDNDIERIEKHTGKKVYCSPESGEYFYKLIPAG